MGLTTALGILPGGWVVVGSLPTTDGTAATAQAGCLLVLDNKGQVAETIAGHGINGPWDMATVSAGPLAALFVTQRPERHGGGERRRRQPGHGGAPGPAAAGKQAPLLVAHTIIGSGFGERTDPAALVVGPTGLGLDSHGTLFVADSVGNRITAIPGGAGAASPAQAPARWSPPAARSTRRSGWPSPRTVTCSPSTAGTVSRRDHPGGQAGRQLLLDNTGSPKPGAGALFGLAVTPNGNGVYYVDDAANTLSLFH